jgi:hypothetical protein
MSYSKYGAEVGDDVETDSPSYTALHLTFVIFLRTCITACLVSKWPSDESAERTQSWIKAGDTLEIESGLAHGLYCDPKLGLTCHARVACDDLREVLTAHSSTLLHVMTNGQHTGS